jgi:hypothetical protein
MQDLLVDLTMKKAPAQFLIMWPLNEEADDFLSNDDDGFEALKFVLPKGKKSKGKNDGFEALKFVLPKFVPLKFVLSNLPEYGTPHPRPSMLYKGKEKPLRRLSCNLIQSAVVKIASTPS